MSRLMISGTGSGCGKTTVTCALLVALKSRMHETIAFKCGPDFIDPMFHRQAIGLPSYNLDPFFMEADALRTQLSTHSKNLALIEGAMGYYDGIGATDEASAYTVARETRTPVILVVNARSAGYSLAAITKGFTDFHENSQIAGVIFNHANEVRYPVLQKIAQDAGVKAYGYLPYEKEWSLQSRHLGLLTVAEVADLQNKLARMGQQAENTLEIEALLELAETAPPLAVTDKPWNIQPINAGRLAVARDDAFCFLYEENLEMLRDLGCEIVFFSPLKDKALPTDISGLYLCGGYPELHAEKLAENSSMRASIRHAIAQGLPCIAESGGFLYLHNTLDGFAMCGVVQAIAFKTNKLQRFGYMHMTAEVDNLLCEKGASIATQEFHYWESSDPGNGFTARKAGRVNAYSCVHATDTLYAGFPHLYFPANPLFAKNFIKRMAKYES